MGLYVTPSNPSDVVFEMPNPTSIQQRVHVTEREIDASGCSDLEK
jgi:hypothetical protein